MHFNSRKIYIGDLESSDFSTPEKRRKNLALIKRWDEKRKRKLHNAQMRVRRLRKRMTSLQQLIDHLKEKSLISESFETTLKVHMHSFLLIIETLFIMS